MMMALGSFAAHAQDYTFSNHNIVPFALNPAQAGAAYATRFALNYRMQWPMLKNAYHTVRLSYDQNIFKRMCSIGVAYTYDNMANGVFQTHELDAIYSHTIRLTRDVQHFLRLGVQASLMSSAANYDKMTFGDQYITSTGQIYNSTIQNLPGDSRTYFDFAVGASYVFEAHVNVGFSVYHIAEPDCGFEEGAQQLSRKYVAQVNFSQDLQMDRGLMSRRGSDNYFYANAYYQNQKTFNQIYLGVGVCLEPMIFGLSWKSNITRTVTTTDEAISKELNEEVDQKTWTSINIPSAMIGAYYKGFQVYYIFDFYFARKKNGSWSNEISLMYVLPTKRKDLCPVVYW